MKTPFDCALGGVFLSDLEDCICVLDVREEAPEMRLVTLPLPSGGEKLLRRERVRLKVGVTFALQTEDPVRRKAALAAVTAWANKGGALTLPDRPGMQLTVVCCGFPALESQDFAAPLQLVFTTTHTPYWEDSAFTQCYVEESGDITIPGNAGSAILNLVVVNDSEEDLTSLTAVSGSTRLCFENFVLPAYTMLMITCTPERMSALIGATSILDCRTADSDDFLLAPCGKTTTVQVTTDQTATVIVSARGRYL